jgi:two-component system cell cycle sensor histidine kinase/response regulator CckA
MGLKSKILSILFIASIASAIVTGFFLVYLLKLFGQISYMREGVSIAVAFAVAVYLLSGLFILVLLNILLSKNIIIPAVEHEMLEKERTMLTDQLHHSQKMEAVGKLAGSIAHDFNNLLTIIDGYSSLIIADPGSPETAQNAEEVVAAARKASFITRKLLSFSEKEKAEPVLLDLNTTLQDTQKMLSRLIGEKIALVTKAYDEPIYVKADPVQIGQVLMNLAVNARDAMPNGGRITIKIGCREVGDGECGKPSKLVDGPYAEIAVHDTGTGIDEETLARIFEAFFTTKESGKGTGLGLSIVKGILKENDGFIDVQSKPGGGATFTLYLPVVDLDAAEVLLEEDRQKMEAVVSSEEIAHEASEETTASTILLVEDDPMIRSLVSQTLEVQGYNVLLAEDGWEGIKVARNLKGNINLLFTDVVMPGLGGAELAVAMQELYPEVKVLFMSGYSRSQLDEEGVPSDASLLEKPFTPDKVVAMVRRLLSE